MTRALLLLCSVLLIQACGKAVPEKPIADKPACIASSLRAEQLRSNLDGFDEEVRVPLAANDKTTLRIKHPSSTSRSENAILFVTGVDGGFIQPADQIYGRIALRMAERGIPSAFVLYRTPGELLPSLADAGAAVNYLKKQGARKISVLGMSFGGAVAIQTAIRVPEVALVVLFSPQGKDTEPVGEMKKQGLLILHSVDDENVPYDSSVDLLARAPRDISKKLVTLQGALHTLDGYSREVDPVVNSWLDAFMPVVAAEPSASKCS
ncbi:MAG: hypothetical protein A2070_07285 [Bdellovibrionales bacterium GWC1_52_8]|nr:MAG: hypothetical protein A2Z97_16435 [Bdellovibrionales bacterium GWB1_52_6]OFZ02786.1 MAG: hypothetical protein A2X97_04230 [Bdellovibrionales bacterium GWA1_52_35]OFZ44149.1 MAG: hypothetical protein A2070_07285 [Bdellovibrionales bacterium GWC1_52_8]